MPKMNKEELSHHPGGEAPSNSQRLMFGLSALAASFPLAGCVAYIYAIVVEGGILKDWAIYRWLVALPASYIACIMLLFGLYKVVSESKARLGRATKALALVGGATAVLLSICW